MTKLEHDIFLAYTGQAPCRVPHWEHWSDPDAETYLTGIDYYEHPRQCRLKMAELYPELRLAVPENDVPIVKTTRDRVEDHRVRWGDGSSATFEHGEKYFRDEEDVFAFSPLAHADMRGWEHVVEHGDFRTQESCDAYFHVNPDGPHPEPEAPTSVSFYNTAFMWPLLSFGWEMFLQCCLDERFERIMDEFACINRRVFSAIARCDANFVVCHDDITTSRGPVCSPAWMRKYVYPRYEEYFSMVKAAGKKVIFMADGNVDQVADNIFACGADGIISEPYTDYKAIAKKHKDCFIAGEGDNRILLRNDPGEIRAMVERMAETSKMSGGYMMCIGNHIPWNVPGEAIKRYFAYSRELCNRG